MKIIPFTTRETKVRVIDSKIGKVVPIVDIAKAIDYKADNLRDMIERNSELFEGTVTPVMGATVQNNRGTATKQQYKVKALNHYGVVGLLMKLDYNRIQDEDKKSAVLRFQRWAMQVLGDKIQGVDTPKRYKCELSNKPYVDKDSEWLGIEEAAVYLDCCKRTVRRYVEKGILPAYRVNRRDIRKYAFLVSDLDKIK